MDNVDVCICCGKVIPEGTMVCCECQNRYDTYKETDTIEFAEKLCGVKLSLYQKFLLKLYLMSLKK